MFINRLSLRQFRNYQEASVGFMVSTTKSHRTSKDSQLILFNEDFARIDADITREHDDLKLSLIISKKGKRASYNGVDQKKLSEYVFFILVSILNY